MITELLIWQIVACLLAILNGFLVVRLRNREAARRVESVKAKAADDALRNLEAFIKDKYGSI